MQDLQLLQQQRQQTQNDTMSQKYKNLKQNKSLKTALVSTCIDNDTKSNLQSTYNTMIFSSDDYDEYKTNSLENLKRLKCSDEKNFKRTFSNLCLTAFGISATILSITQLLKIAAKKKIDLPSYKILPELKRNININKEEDFAVYVAIQNPTFQTIMATLGVLTLTVLGAIGKNFVDGFKQIWVKKQEAKAQRNLQADLIDVEANVFSGKLNIQRQMLKSTAKELEKYLNMIDDDSKIITTSGIAFSHNHKSTKNEKDKSSILYWLFGCATLLSIGMFTVMSFKNIRKIGQYSQEYKNKFEKRLQELVQQNIQKIPDDLKNIEMDFPQIKEISNILVSLRLPEKKMRSFLDKLTLTDPKAKKKYEDLLEKNKKQIEQINKQINKQIKTSTEDVSQLMEMNKKLSNEITKAEEEYTQHERKMEDLKRKYVDYIVKEALAIAQEASVHLAGQPGNKASFVSFTDDVRAHLYNFIVNDCNPILGTLFLALLSIAVGGYVGSVGLVGLKEAQVAKYNAETELELQRKLVDIELENYRKKKEVMIKPLMTEFIRQVKLGRSKEDLTIMAESILFEVKNGPPYLFS